MKRTKKTTGILTIFLFFSMKSYQIEGSGQCGRRVIFSYNQNARH